MIILGIDPGIAITGFGIIEKNGHQLIPRRWGAITTPAGLDLAERLADLYRDMQAIITQANPDCIAIESIFFSNNAKTAMAVGHARGVVLLATQQANLPMGHYTPPQVKAAVTGQGNADKKQVQTMVTTLLNLQKVPKPDDVADALAVAICHAHSVKLQSYV